MIKTKIYQVNRSDRASMPENHRFIEWTVVGILTVTTDNFLFSVCNCHSDRGKLGLTSPMRTSYQKEFDENYYKEIRTDPSVLYIQAVAKNIHHLVELININQGLGGSFYLEKDFAENELVRLIEGEIKSQSDRLKTTKKVIKDLKSVLNERNCNRENTE